MIMAALAGAHGRFLQVYRGPVGVEEAWAPQEVRHVMERVEERVELEGLHAVGMVAYEAGAGLDPALPWRSPGPWPLVWFAFFPPPTPTVLPPVPPVVPVSWEPELDEAGYRRVVGQVRELLEAGETYQVNLTYRLRARWSGDPWALFLHMLHQQPSAHAAFVDCGTWAVCSASPELFVCRSGSTILSQPMKGTAPRGRFLDEDQTMAQRLQSSPKERAENIMIVDMVRNDLTRVCHPPSVRVTRLCAVERHPTLWQMTSSVLGKTSAGLGEIFAALFPAASITGAPKIRTAGIIHELEPSPRRIYTGAMGVVRPGGRTRFNVAIRTALIHRQHGEAEYGVGGGIVWDSVDQAEWRETLLKARILGPSRPPFGLIETMRATPHGVPLWPWHLERLTRSARYWGYALDEQALVAERDHYLQGIHRPCILRLELWPSGFRHWQVLPLPVTPRPYWLVWGEHPVALEEPWRYHKTTRRQVLTAEEKRALALGAHDALLCTPQGWVVETTRANLVVRLRGRWFTPALSCGPLPGVARARLLARGKVRESHITREDVLQAEALFLINAVRGLWRAGVLDYSSNK
jgi:para-aminobenzoate synthetase/4-amino-4-deoxychorismate lyase